MARTGQFATGERPRDYSPADDRVICEMLAEEATWDMIAEALGRRHTGVVERFRQIRRRMGWQAS